MTEYEENEEDELAYTDLENAKRTLESRLERMETEVDETIRENAYEELENSYEVHGDVIHEEDIDWIVDRLEEETDDAVDGIDYEDPV